MSGNPQNEALKIKQPLRSYLRCCLLFFRLFKVMAAALYAVLTIFQSVETVAFPKFQRTI